MLIIRGERYAIFEHAFAARVSLLFNLQNRFTKEPLLVT